MFINSSLLNEKAADKIRSEGIDLKVVSNKAWLLGVRLSNGQTVAAYPISRINPSAPPKFYMTDTECDSGVDNREPLSKIVKGLNKWCKEDDLRPAIREMKRAIKLLES